MPVLPSIRSYVEGQMQGGTVQGLGWALSEDYTYAPDGRMLNSSFLDYRMPTALDLPMIETVIVEVPNPRHPYGLRGVGEAPIIPPLAAFAQRRLSRCWRAGKQASDFTHRGAGSSEGGVARPG